MRPSVELSDELVSFLDRGNSMPFGTRDAQNRPTAMRAIGARVAPDRQSLFVYLPDATSARTLANLRDNGRVAVTFSSPSTYRTLQIKGQCIGIEPSTDDDVKRQRAYLALLVEELELIGMARETTQRLSHAPSMAIHIRIEEIFEQTPGPGAGNRLAAGR